MSSPPLEVGKDGESQKPGFMHRIIPAVIFFLASSSSFPHQVTTFAYEPERKAGFEKYKGICTITYFCWLKKKKRYRAKIDLKNLYGVDG